MSEPRSAGDRGWRPLGVWLLGVWLAVVATLAWPGFVLNNDSVAVPSQDLLPWMWGAGTAPPRSVPQDAVVAVLDEAIPGWLIQRLLIVGGFVLLGLGVARFLRERSRFEQAAAATFAVFSTFLYERMLMGHWGLLLGLAALPWAMRAAADLRVGRPGSLVRLIGWTLVGSLVPSAGALMTGAVAVVLLWPGLSADAERHMVSRGAGLLGVAAVQLVWVIPGIRNPGSGSAATAEVFGLRAEGVAGPLLTALGTGGIWNAAVAPESRIGPMSLIAPGVLLVLAALGRWEVRGLPRPILGALMVTSLLGLVWALLTAAPAAGPLVTWVQSLPGGGLLRDAQKWLAPWVILLSVTAGLGLGRVRERLRGTEAWWPGTVLLLLIPILLLPDLLFGAWGRLSPATYPSEWEQVRTALAKSEAPGDVVSLPWSAFRAYDWNSGRTVLDPAPRYLPRTVVTDSRLLVQEAGELIVVESDDPRSTAVGRALLVDDPTSALSGLGIGWVLWQKDQLATPGYPAELPPALESSSTLVSDGSGLALYRIPGSVDTWAPEGSRFVLLASWASWILAVAVVMAGSMRLWGRRGTPGERHRGGPLC